MVNETWWIGEWLDIGGQPRSDVNKVTEEAVRRIQDQSKKAQQVHQQIQDDKTNNTNIAKFLSFLIETIKNEHIISLLYDVFFKTKNPETGVTHLRKKINVTVISGFFYPFYIKEAEKLGVSGLFETLLAQQKWSMNFHIYIAYIKQLAGKYHDNIALDQEYLLKLLLEIIKYFKIHGESWSPEEDQITISKLKKELF